MRWELFLRVIFIIEVCTAGFYRYKGKDKVEGNYWLIWAVITYLFIMNS